MFKLPAQSSTESVFTLFRKANQVAQTRPELAAELRLLAVYGKKQDQKVKDGSNGRSIPVVSRPVQKPAFVAEVRVPRIFVSLFDSKPAFA